MRFLAHCPASYSPASLDDHGVGMVLVRRWMRLRTHGAGQPALDNWSVVDRAAAWNDQSIHIAVSLFGVATLPRATIDDVCPELWRVLEHSIASSTAAAYQFATMRILRGEMRTSTMPLAAINYIPTLGVEVRGQPQRVGYRTVDRLPNNISSLHFFAGAAGAEPPPW